jgi:hypothetical protein
MKMMEGALSRAIWKRFETSFSLSPIHLETRSEEETLQKASSGTCQQFWSEKVGGRQELCPGYKDLFMIYQWNQTKRDNSKNLAFAKEPAWCTSILQISWIMFIDSYLQRLHNYISWSSKNRGRRNFDIVYAFNVQTLTWCNVWVTL